MIIESFCEEDTYEFAKKLALESEVGRIITLDGDLGAGKTLFTQGFAAGLDITEAVNSPTFTIMQIYDSGRIPLYHFDVYRIEDSMEMEEIGFDDFIFGNGISIIEWATQIEDILPKHYTKIVITRDVNKGFDYRKIELIEL